MTLRSLFEAAANLHSVGEAARSAGEVAAETSLRSSAPSADRLREDLQRMRGDIERLLMIAEALWSMVQEQHGYTDEELFRRITEIDLSDGRADGRVAPSPPAACPACGRRVSRRHTLCLYCGRPMVSDPFAR